MTNRRFRPVTGVFEVVMSLEECVADLLSRAESRS